MQISSASTHWIRVPNHTCRLTRPQPSLVSGHVARERKGWSCMTMECEGWSPLLHDHPGSSSLVMHVDAWQGSARGDHLSYAITPRAPLSHMPSNKRDSWGQVRLIPSHLSCWQMHVIMEPKGWREQILRKATGDESGTVQVTRNHTHLAERCNSWWNKHIHWLRTL